MSNKVLAYTLLRVFMGLNVFMHGAVRLGPNYRVFIEWVQGLYAETWLPTWLVTLEASIIPGWEMLVGILILFGYKTRWGIALGMVLMMSLVFGMTLIQDWELVNRHIVYSLAFYLLLYNLDHNEVSLDARLAKR